MHFSERNIALLSVWRHIHYIHVLINAHTPSEVVDQALQGVIKALSFQYLVGLVSWCAGWDMNWEARQGEVTKRERCFLCEQLLSAWVLVGSEISGWDWRSMTTRHSHVLWGSVHWLKSVCTTVWCSVLDCKGYNPFVVQATAINCCFVSSLV